MMMATVLGILEDTLREDDGDVEIYAWRMWRVMCTDKREERPK